MNKISSHLSKDPVLKKLVKQYPNVIKDWEEMQKEKRDVFNSIARTIVGQQLSVKAAKTIWERVATLIGQITPENILKYTDQEYRNAGMSWAKASYLISLANDVKNKNFYPSKLHGKPIEVVEKELIALKGIGKWSAEMIMMFTLNEVDVFSIGDMGLKNAIQNLYGIDKKDEEKILSLSENWKPYRTVACLYLWESLDNKPK